VRQIEKRGLMAIDALSGDPALPTPSVLSLFIARVNEEVGAPVLTISASDENTAGLLQSDPAILERPEAISHALEILAAKLHATEVYAAQLARSTVALRRELYVVSRSLSEIDSYIQRLPMLPSPDSRAAGTAREIATALKTGGSLTTVIRAATRGMCGLGLTVWAAEPALLEIQAVGRESGMILGAWAVEVAADVDHVRLSMGRGLTLAEAEFELCITSIEGDVHVGPTASEPSADGATHAVITPMVFRLAAGLRVPQGWGVPPMPANDSGTFEQDGLHPRRSVLPWSNEVQWWSIAKRRRRGRLTEKSSNEMPGSFVSPRLDYVQVHPLPGRLTIAAVALPRVAGPQFQIRAFFGHREAGRAEIWVGLCAKTELDETNGPGPALRASITQNLERLSSAEDSVDFTLRPSAGQDLVLLVTSVEDAQSNEYAWVRFAAPTLNSSTAVEPEDGSCPG
jgi:hypothetical protein